ncbi:MAG: divalent-cation tolerance protein CutA [Gemmatimonadota bacterium]
MTTDVRVALVTGPDAATMRDIVRTLVRERLIACANVLDGVTSSYRWEGEVEEASECLVVLKTTVDRVPALEARLAGLHPYDVPEFIVMRVDEGSEAYLDWVRDSVAAD